MKTLIAALALCALAYARCPKINGPITPQDINSVDTVAYVTVTGKTAKAYNLQYFHYYDVPKPAPSQWPALGTVILPGCTLNVGTDYILGCKGQNNCKFVRPYDELTAEELKLLEK